MEIIYILYIKRRELEKGFLEPLDQTDESHLLREG